MKLTSNANVFAAAALACLSTNSIAGSITLDSFATNQTSGTTINNPASSGSAIIGANYWSSRTFNLIPNSSGTIDAGASIVIVDGQLQISNGNSPSSRSTITWSLDLSSLSAALLSTSLIELSLDQGEIDTTQVDVSATAGPGTQPRTPSNNLTSIILYRGTVTGLPNSFVVTFDSSRKADSDWRNFASNYTCVSGATTLTESNKTADKCGASVPTPGGLILVTLGGLALIRSSRNRSQ